MSIDEYGQLQQRAEQGNSAALGEIIKIAMSRCDCESACFFARRAREFLRGIGMEIAA